MKKIILSLLTISSFLGAFAQDDYKKQPSFAVHFYYNDFQTAAEIRANGLANVLKENNYFKTSRMTPGLAIAIFRALAINLISQLLCRDHSLIILFLMFHCY